MKPALVLNVGSSSLKWSLLEGRGPKARSGNAAWASERELSVVLARLPESVAAVGHRLVHGGSKFRASVRIDDAVRAALNELAVLDPLHTPAALRVVDLARERWPSVPQLAVFDSAFHATLPDEAALYALPWEWTTRFDLRRYGFHGLSVEYAVQRSAELLGALPARLLVCHLGSGCSLTAVAEGRSIDTTMGFTPLEGVVMATRSGSVDPGLLLYLLRQGLSVDEIERGLIRASGLAGVSGLSADLREVLAKARTGEPRATLAVALFNHSVLRAAGAMVAVLGGLDALVFTGGIGEHQPEIRAALGKGLAFAGVALDDARNAEARGDVDIGAARAAVQTLVIAAREELVVWRELERLLPAELACSAR